MLTRLQVSGFKNLVDVDVRFGPFTCIAGANGTGKSNLFDAIQFLGRLASDTFVDAAASIRADEDKGSSVQSLFHRIGSEYADSISFTAEMIVPDTGVDDLGQEAKATFTFLRYSLELAYQVDGGLPYSGSFELMQESLEHIKLGEASRHLRFQHSAKDWRNSVVKGRRAAPFISTVEHEGQRVVRLHQDGGSSGRPQSFSAKNLPRTVLSTANALESPTALLARREMQSWRLLQLEPSSLRKPDEFMTPPGMRPDGSHLPATLYSLANTVNQENSDSGDTWVYEQIALRLSDLIDDVYEVSIDRDEKRQLLTLQVQDKNGTTYPARSLSDGTLRFLALAVLALDPTALGVMCLEEPENGIHPGRISAMLELLQDIAVNVHRPVAADNPLRQVIVNTHSPGVVNLIPPDSLLIAETEQAIHNSKRFQKAAFRWRPNTWRSKASPEDSPVIMGRLLPYLSPIPERGGQLGLPIENTDLY
ncbi:MAG: AAA family ATPase [Caldilineaceae bacterium]|nr:AAA family ATPase [Caldilineaceae bacterium]MDE0338356.1 AAA family ATPase [Caldilineaceae bacterium]